MNFDSYIAKNRRHHNSLKWTTYPEDVIPLWVADMDFIAAEPIRQAIQDCVQHGVFGYAHMSNELQQTIAKRLKYLFNWDIDPEHIVDVPGAHHATNIAAETFCQPGHGFLIHTPAYPPFLSKTPKNGGLICQTAPLKPIKSGNTITYQLDWDTMKDAVHKNGIRTEMFLLCSPHNPTGHIFSQQDLQDMAEFCRQEKILICADEIFSELTLDGPPHIPIASLSPEIAEQSISIFSASKTYNLPGLYTSFVIIPNPTIRQKFVETVSKRSIHTNSIGLATAMAAYSGTCDPWKTQMLNYIKSNRDLLMTYVQEYMPEIQTTCPHATYLAWMDVKYFIDNGKIKGRPADFFLHKARIAVSDGLDFGCTTPGFIRLNMGCDQNNLKEALQRMKKALYG